MKLLPYAATAGLFASILLAPAQAASVARTYSYFSVGGSTLSELQDELAIHGPKLASTGSRHPGATEMVFTNRITYKEARGDCAVKSAMVSVKAKIILPRWRKRGSAERDARLVWDTLASDIKRHEESHVSIAKAHAREMEQAVLALPRGASCAAVGEKAKATVARILAKHDAEQARFDKIEAINFSKRLERLLRYRIQQIEAGRIPG